MHGHPSLRFFLVQLNQICNKLHVSDKRRPLIIVKDPMLSLMFITCLAQYKVDITHVIHVKHFILQCVFLHKVTSQLNNT